MFVDQLHRMKTDVQQDKTDLQQDNNNNNFILFFCLNANALVNADTVRPGGGEKTLRSSHLPPPNHVLPKTLSERAHEPCANQQKRKQRAEHCSNLTHSHLYNPNNEQDNEIIDTIHMQDKFQVNVALQNH